MSSFSRRWLSNANVQWIVNSPTPLSPRKTGAVHPKSRRILPKSIVVVRHGQSLGNVRESLFAELADWKIPLSKKGHVQARAAGTKIQDIVGSGPVLFYVSPYKRTKQTLDEIKSQFSEDSLENTLFTREEPRLREQDFGNFQDVNLIKQFKKERPKFGRFFYRFPHGGESGADVFDRVSAFCGTFLQDLDQCGEAADDATAIFVTHGITARLFIMRWLHWTVEDFEETLNPPNCGIMHLRRREDGSAYRLTEESKRLIGAPEDEGIGRALQIGDMLKKRKRLQPSALSTDERRAFDSLTETAWGI